MRICFPSTLKAKFSLSALLLLALLSGCGGGSSSSPTPVATATPGSVPIGKATSTARPTATPGATPIQGQRRVACVGDSITFGTKLSHRDENSYPVVLGRLLGSKYQVGNFGVPGATMLDTEKLSYQKQTAFTQALQFKPSIVIVMLGTNDSKKTFDFKVGGIFKQDYKTLIAAFRKVNPGVKVYTCLPIPSYPQERDENVTLSTRILPLIRQVAGETDSQVIDLNTPFTNRLDLYIDVLHPNIVGARLLATDVFNDIT